MVFPVSALLLHVRAEVLLDEDEAVREYAARGMRRRAMAEKSREFELKGSEIYLAEIQNP